jgi:hypothetical protein
MADEAKTPPKLEVKKMTVLEQLKKLDEQRTKLIEDAKAAAMKKVQEGIDDLTAIGFLCKLVEIKDEEPSARKRGAREGAGQVDPNKPCSVCNFLTSPNHDARKHRAQGDNKKPFTAKDLEQFGLKKV